MPANPPQHADAGLHRLACLAVGVYFAMSTVALPGAGERPHVLPPLPFVITRESITVKITGDTFSPSEAERVTGLSLSDTIEPGGFASRGRYKDQPSPFGYANLRAPDEDAGRWEAGGAPRRLPPARRDVPSVGRGRHRCLRRVLLRGAVQPHVLARRDGEARRTRRAVLGLVLRRRRPARRGGRTRHCRPTQRVSVWHAGSASA